MSVDANTKTQQATIEMERLRSAAIMAHYEMRRTIAPRDSFTDALDALDAALYPRDS